jgi:hypothetical protein
MDNNEILFSLYKERNDVIYSSIDRIGEPYGIGKRQAQKDKYCVL